VNERWPPVSVVMPVRDEAQHLRRAVSAVLAQDYPGTLEVVIAVAPSADPTEDVARALAADPRVRVVDNPAASTSAGLNAAIAASTGEVVARVDGHAELPSGYLRRAVTVLRETGADNVGGVQEAVGRTPFERAVAAAMTSRFGTGDARFHYGGEAGPADTVYLGVFRRQALERVGGFEQSLVRNQDYELNWRIRQSGGTVWFDPTLRTRYQPRSSLGALARQYGEYGRWKRAMLRRHPQSLRWRQLAPPFALLGLLAGLFVAFTVSPWGYVVPAVYLAAVLVASLLGSRRAGFPGGLLLPVVFATMHLAWGAGFLLAVRGAPLPEPDPL